MATTHSTCPSEPSEAREWNAGYNHGLYVDFISPRDYRYHSSSFIVGYEVGRAELNHAIDEYRKPREY